MTLAEELRQRGFVYQHSGTELEDIFDAGETRTVYLGIDPTADSMHVGHLVPYMLLNHITRAGHAVVLLMGGGTGLIGDPSGKDTEREMKDIETIQTQCAELQASIERITTSKEIRFVNNYDWLSKLTLIEFLRDVGKHFTVNAMVKKDSVSARLSSEQGISFTEFSYALLQSYDYYHLYTEYGCDVQIGGSDQWGNISSGIDFIRRKTGDEVHGLTLPLLINPQTGKKFGKTEGGAIWLDPELTSPYQFYQFWLNTPDEVVINYLNLFTFCALEEITKIESDHAADPSARIAQRRLAHEVTAFVHGADAATLASDVSNTLFSGGDIHELNSEGRAILLENAPVSEAREGESIIELLIESGLAKSKNEARTLISEGAITLGEERVSEPTAVVVKSMFTDDLLLLRRGKRQVCVIRYAS